MTLTSPLHIRQTEAFIAENPVDVIVNRSTRVPTGTGGFTKSASAPLDPQTVRIVGSSLVGAESERTSADGKVVLKAATLVALPDADFEIGDTFDTGDETYEVVTIGKRPPWRLSAELATYG